MNKDLKAPEMKTSMPRRLGDEDLHAKKTQRQRLMHQEGLGDTPVRLEDTRGKGLRDEDLRIKKVIEMKT